MHRCMYVQEIVTSIAREGLDDQDRELRRGTLALARTCRALYEPTIDVVWRHIPNLEPLAGCISDEIWDSGARASDNSVFRTIQPGDLARLHDLSRRVRIYGFETNEGSELSNLVDDSEVFQLLSLVTGNQKEQTLFPNLKKANLINISLERLPLIHLFTNPNMLDLKISMTLVKWSRPEIFRRFCFLNSLGGRFPNLRSFELSISTLFNDSYDSDFNKLISESLAEVICSANWKNLASLRLGTRAAFRTLKPLFYMPSLRHLHLELDTDPSRSLLGSNVPTKPHRGARKQPPKTPHIFPNIQTVDLRVAHLSTITGLCDSLSPDNDIRTFHINAYEAGGSSLSHWREILQSMRNKLDKRRLRDIKLDDLNAEPHTTFSLSITELSNLFPFTELTHLAIRCQGTIDLDELAIQHLARSWPKIEHLELLGLTVLGIPHKLTLTGLAAFAENCPSLRSLAIEFDASQPPTSLPRQRPRHGEKLTSLDVSCSPVKETQLVAAFLTGIFPNIKEVANGWEEEEGGDERFCSKASSGDWTLVNWLLPVLKVVRLNEMHRAIAGNTGDYCNCQVDVRK